MVETEGRGQKTPEPPSTAKPIAAGLAFSALAQVRNMEAQLQWVGFQSSIQLNVLGWAGITVWLLNSANNQELWLAFLASLGAVIGNCIHYKILGRDGKFMGLWNEKLTALEKENRRLRFLLSPRSTGRGDFFLLYALQYRQQRLRS